MDIAQIRSFFFKAMMEGWAMNAQEIKTTDAPGYTSIPFREGDFYLLDRYCVSPNSSKSAGTTTIWFQDIPVWLMNYGGFYEKRTIACLKEALQRTYGVHQFVGGRGPRMHSKGSLVYVNQPRLNDFAKFEGREEIFDIESGELFGFHEYWGISLL